jgi:hypothetical protein
MSYKNNIDEAPKEIQNDLETLFYQRQAKHQLAALQAKERVKADNTAWGKFKQTEYYHLPGAMGDTVKKGAGMLKQAAKNLLKKKNYVSKEKA